MVAVLLLVSGVSVSALSDRSEVLRKLDQSHGRRLLHVSVSALSDRSEILRAVCASLI